MSFAPLTACMECWKEKKEQKEDMIESDYILYIAQMPTAEVMHKLWASGRAFWEQWKDFHQPVSFRQNNAFGVKQNTIM